LRGGFMRSRCNPETDKRLSFTELSLSAVAKTICYKTARKFSTANRAKVRSFCATPHTLDDAHDGQLAKADTALR